MFFRTLSLAGAALVVVACQEAATGPEFDDYRGAVTAASENAAFRYEGDLCLVLDPDGNIWSGQVTSTTTNGNAGRVNATCALGTLPNETGRAITHKDVNCGWFADPATFVGSVEAHMVVRPDGEATAQCHFRQSPPTAFVEGDGFAAAAIEGAFTVPLTRDLTGDLVDIGAACDADLPLPDLTGKIALILRQNCPSVDENFFQAKILKAENAGAIAAIVYNTAAGGDFLVTMGGDPSVPDVSIPGVFVGHSTGLALQSSASATIGSCVQKGKSLTCGGVFKQGNR